MWCKAGGPGGDPSYRLTRHRRNEDGEIAMARDTKTDRQYGRSDLGLHESLVEISRDDQVLVHVDGRLHGRHDDAGVAMRRPPDERLRVVCIGRAEGAPLEDDVVALEHVRRVLLERTLDARATAERLRGVDVDGEVHRPADRLEHVVLVRGEVFGDEEREEALLAVDVRQTRLAVVLAVRDVPRHLREEVVVHVHRDCLARRRPVQRLCLVAQAVPRVLLAVGVADHLVLAQHDLRELPARPATQRDGSSTIQIKCCQRYRSSVVNETDQVLSTIQIKCCQRYRSSVVNETDQVLSTIQMKCCQRDRSSVVNDTDEVLSTRQIKCCQRYKSSVVNDTDQVLSTRQVKCCQRYRSSVVNETDQVLSTIQIKCCQRYRSSIINDTNQVLSTIQMKCCQRDRSSVVNDTDQVLSTIQVKCCQRYRSSVVNDTDQVLSTRQVKCCQRYR